MLTLNCLAAPIDSVKENMDTQSVTVSGSELVAGDKVLIEVFNFDDESIDYEADLEGIIAVTADENGSYTASFRLPERAASGLKKVFAKPIVGRQSEQTLEFYSSSDIEQILSNWNDAINNKDKAKMENVINDETALKIILNSPLVPTLRQELLEKDKSAVTEKLLQSQPASNVDDVAAAFKDPYLNFALNNLSKETAAKLLLEFYDSIDTKKGDVYQNIISKLSDSEKLTVFENAISQKTANAANGEIVSLAYSCAVFGEFSKISYYSDVKPFIDTYNTEYFKIDTSIYDKVKNTYEVDSKVLTQRSSYTDFETFKAKYELWAKEQYDSENSSNGSTGGTGGGGGGKKTSSSSGGGGGVINPVKEEIFADLADFDWAKEHIMALYNKGVIDGIGDKEFAPEQTVTREQFVKIASALCTMPEAPSDAGFEDVVSGSWYEKYVNGAKAISLISGKDEKTFGVGENITRQDAAVVLFNALKISKPEAVEGISIDELGFADSDSISAYALYAVSVLNKLGVINGDNNGYFNPTANATRAEAAVMINKVLKLI